MANYLLLVFSVLVLITGSTFAAATVQKNNFCTTTTEKTAGMFKQVVECDYWRNSSNQSKINYVLGEGSGGGGGGFGSVNVRLVNVSFVDEEDAERSPPKINTLQPGVMLSVSTRLATLGVVLGLLLAGAFYIGIFAKLVKLRRGKKAVKWALVFLVLLGWTLMIGLDKRDVLQRSVLPEAAAVSDAVFYHDGVELSQGEMEYVLQWTDFNVTGVRGGFEVSYAHRRYRQWPCLVVRKIKENPALLRYELEKFLRNCRIPPNAGLFVGGGYS